MGAADGGHVCVIMGGALERNLGEGTTATAKLLVELLLEGLAQEPEGKRVDTGVGEHQDSSHNTADKVCHRSVHLHGEENGASVRSSSVVTRGLDYATPMLFSRNDYFKVLITADQSSWSEFAVNIDGFILILHILVPSIITLFFPQSHCRQTNNTTAITTVFFCHF